MYTLKAMGPADLRVVEVPDPVPAAGEVVVSVRACGICGSDKWFWRVTEPTDDVAGHEVAGEVVAVGPGVARLRVGDRVAVNNVRGCGDCPACRAGAFARCAAGIVHMSHGFAELVAVPDRNCLTLADGIGFEAACLMFDTWGTPLAALDRVGVSAGDRVAVFGCGPIGLGAVALAAGRGAAVVAVDGIGGRREAALRLGARAAVAPDDSAAARMVDLFGGTGPDVAIECSAAAGAYRIAMAALRIGGTLVVLGEGAEVELRPSEALIPKYLTVLGSLYSTMAQGQAVQELITSGRIDPLAFDTHRFALPDLPSVFGTVVDCADGLLKAIVTGSV